MRIFEYQILSSTLCIGEPIVRGTYRRCVKHVIPYSTVTGCLRLLFSTQSMNWYDESNPIHACGFITNSTIQTIVGSPEDRVLGTSKLPIQTEFLSDVKGQVYILLESDLTIPSVFTAALGALKSKGFGATKFQLNREIINPSRRDGILRTRIPIAVKDKFGISEYTSVLGYLFKPTNETEGIYVPSLFEGSSVNAYDFLLE